MMDALAAAMGKTLNPSPSPSGEGFPDVQI
jgi:hypothetical protein